MLSLLALLAAYGGWRLTRSALRTLACVPRSNDDFGM